MKKLILSVVVLATIVSIGSLAFAAMNWIFLEGAAPVGSHQLIIDSAISLRVEEIRPVVDCTEEIIFEDPIQEESFVERCQYEKISFGRAI